MPPVNQAQHFGDIHIEGQGQLTINQVVQISVAEVKTRAFVPGSPYVGLRRFEERNKDFFFGRDRLVEQILQSLLQRNFVLVTGPSGSGKSSVVRAGLIPLVASQFAQGCFRTLVLTPDRDPFSSLRAALQSAGIAQSRLTELDARTADAVKSVLTETRPPDERWVLVVDQFERVVGMTGKELAGHLLESEGLKLGRLARRAEKGLFGGLWEMPALIVEPGVNPYAAHVERVADPHELRWVLNWPELAAAPDGRRSAPAARLPRAYCAR